MVRARLTILVLALLAATLAMAGALVWSAQRAQQHLERSRIAHEELDVYLALSEAAHRHFKQLGDLAVAGASDNGDDLAESERRLRERLAALQDLTEHEIGIVEGGERREEIDEIGRIFTLKRTLEDILAQYEALRRRLVGEGDASAWPALFRLSEERIYRMTAQAETGNR